MSVSLTIDQRKEITAYINHYRSLHQAPPLTWNNDIAVVSENWSAYLLSNNLFQHSQNPLYGENLAFFQGYGTDILTLLKLAVDGWYNEISEYNFSRPGFSQATGHFTCLVWASSKQFAISIALDKSTTACDIVFNTSPPGNVQGGYVLNVLPKRSVPPVPIPLPPVPIPLPPVPIPVPLPPVQLPLPVPLPVPLPPVPVPLPHVPLPLPNKSTIRMIINNLHNIIFLLNTNRSVYVIVQYIQNIIAEISTITLPDQNAIQLSLNSIVHLLQTHRYRNKAIQTIYDIIAKLNTYL
jgi:hypothetical protein